MTDYSNLLDEGRIKRGRFSSKQVWDCLKIADRDMEAAKANLDTHPEWAYMMVHQTGGGTRSRAVCGFRVSH